MLSSSSSSIRNSFTVSRKRKLKDIVQAANDLVIISQEIIDFYDGKLSLHENDKEVKIARLKDYCESGSSFLDDKDKAWISEQIEDERKDLAERLYTPVAIEAGLEKTRAYLLKSLSFKELWYFNVGKLFSSGSSVRKNWKKGRKSLR